MGQEYYTIVTACDGLTPETCESEIPSQIVGDIIFFLALITFLQLLVACGLFFNTFTKK